MFALASDTELLINPARQSQFLLLPSLRVSSDDGRTWNAVRATGLGTAYCSTGLDSMSASVFLGDGTIVGSDGMRSVDGGRSWTQMFDANGHTACVTAIAADPNSPSNAWGCLQNTLPVRIVSTSDSGATWQQSSTIPSFSGCQIAVQPGSGGVILVGGSKRSAPLMRSVDGGQTWSRARVGFVFPPTLTTPARALAFDPKHPSIVLGLGYDGNGLEGKGIYRSTDAGAHWRAVQLGQFSSQCNGRAGGGSAGGAGFARLAFSPAGVAVLATVCASTVSGQKFGPAQFYASRDGGVHWTRLSVPANTLYVLGDDGGSFGRGNFATSGNSLLYLNPEFLTCTPPKGAPTTPRSTWPQAPFWKLNSTATAMVWAGRFPTK